MNVGGGQPGIAQRGVVTGAPERTVRLVIEPRQPGLRHRLRELWRYRRLIRFFGKQFLERRYRRTILGWIWIPLRPLLTVFSRVLVFGALLAVPSNDVPYFLFFLVGYGTWQLFALYLMWATRSLEMTRKLLKRLYFPRLVLPIAAAVPAAIEFAVYVALGGLTVAYFGLFDGDTYLSLDFGLLLVPAGLGMCVALAFGIGLWTCVFGAHARDVRFTLNFILGFWMYLTPIIYPLSAIPERFQPIAALNPLTAPVEMVKKGLLDAGDVQNSALAVSFGVIVVAILSGMTFFARAEAAAVDRL
jgi:lipopolysaccharide transport system permease protein